jgi:hypothetical protein
MKKEARQQRALRAKACGKQKSEQMWNFNLLG